MHISVNNYRGFPMLKTDNTLIIHFDCFEAMIQIHLLVEMNSEAGKCLVLQEKTARCIENF